MGANLLKRRPRLRWRARLRALRPVRDQIPPCAFSSSTLRARSPADDCAAPRAPYRPLFGRQRVPFEAV